VYDEQITVSVRWEALLTDDCVRLSVAGQGRLANRGGTDDPPRVGRLLGPIALGHLAPVDRGRGWRVLHSFTRPIEGEAIPGGREGDQSEGPSQRIG
jgi:hypothetical protein